MLYFLENNNKKIYIHNMNIYFVEKYLEAISKYNPNDIYLNHKIKDYKKQLLSQKYFLQTSHQRKKDYYIKKEVRLSQYCNNFLKNFVKKLKNQKNKEFLIKCLS